VKPEPQPIVFASTDDGAEVLAYVTPTPEGHISIAFAHELDGELELVLEPAPAKELTAALLRALKEVSP
jgi:hypothetical protein